MTTDRQFDSVKFMRDAREKLSRQVEGLSADEQNRLLDERIRESPEIRRIYERLKSRFSATV